MDAVIIRLIDLPYSVKGLTVKDSEGDYNIYLNARLSDQIRVDAFKHEINHIRAGHFYTEMPVKCKEMQIAQKR